MNTIYEDLGEIIPKLKGKIKIKKVVKQQDSEGNEVYTLQSSSLLEDSFALEPTSTPPQFSEKNRIESLFASAFSTISGIDNTFQQIKSDSFLNFDKKEYSRPSLLLNNEKSVHNNNNNTNNKQKSGSENSLMLSNKLNQIIQKDYSNNNLSTNRGCDMKIVKNENFPKKLNKNKKISNNKSLFHSDFGETLGDCNKNGNKIEINNDQKTSFEDPLNEFKRKMFRSHSETNTKKTSFFEDLKEFMLPNDVLKIFKESDENIYKMKIHLTNEKNKIDQELNEFLVFVERFISLKKQELFKRFDYYLLVFEENYDVFLNKVKNYKESSLKKSEFNKKTPLISLTEINFELDSLRLKSEKYASTFHIPLNKMTQEITKKEILFLSNELNKQMTHIPLFNYSETSRFLLNEAKTTLFNEIKAFFEDFDKLIYETPLKHFNLIKTSPKISNLVLSDHLNAIGSLSIKEVISKKIFETNHKESINSLLLFDEKTLVTASKDGEIKIWDVSSCSLLDTFDNKAPINCIAKFEANEEEFHGKQNLLKKFLFKPRQNFQKYLATAGKSLKIWNIYQKNVIFEFCSCYHEPLTSLIVATDRQTLITSSNEKILIWNVNKGNEVKILNDHKKGVNCLFLLRDNSKFISGGDDGNLKIWRLYFIYCVKSQRKIVEKIELEMNLFDFTPIYSINQGFLDENLLIIGGLGVIRIWDLKQNLCKKELKVEENDKITQIILIENIWAEKNKGIGVLSEKDGVLQARNYEDNNSEIQIFYAVEDIKGTKAQILKMGEETQIFKVSDINVVAYTIAN